MAFVCLVGIEYRHAQVRVAGLARVAVATFKQGLGVHILLGEHVVDVADLLDQGLGIDAMLLVVGNLLGAATVSLVDGLPHGFGGLVGVHDHRAGHVSGRTADGLDERTIGAQESFLVGVKNRHQRYFRQIEALTQQVDTDNHIDLAFAQHAQQFDAAQRIHIRMQVFDLDAAFQQIVGQVLGHLLGQSGDQRALVLGHTGLDLGEQIVDLPLDRAYVDLRVQQTGWADNLFDHPIGQSHLIVAWRGGQVHGLADALQEFRPFEWSVVHRGGQAEAVFDQRALAGGIALVHGTDLRHSDV